MKAITRLTRDVGLGYVTGLIGTFLTGVTAGLFPSAVFGAMTEYSADWYKHYWYFVCIASLVAIAQYFILHRTQNNYLFLRSVIACVALFIIYSATVFPNGKPILDGVHTQWRFPMFLVATFQFTAIVLAVAVRLISKMMEDSTSAPTS